MLAKLYGRPAEEAALFSNRAARVRDIGVVTAMYGGVLFISLTLLASMATAMIYGVGGSAGHRPAPSRSARWSR